MKMIILTAIAAVTLATTASAWQTTNFNSYGNTTSWNSFGNQGYSSGSMHKLWLNRPLLQLLNEANTLDFPKINTCLNAVSRKLQSPLPPLPCGFSGFSIFR